MKISQFLNKKSIIANIKATDKKGIIDELALAISKNIQISSVKIAQILMEREQLGSTGIGGGIAIPHGRLELDQPIVIGFGLSKAGIQYDSIDNKPVHIFFLLLTSKNSTGGHLKILAQISRLLKIDEFKKGLLAANCVDDIYDIIMDKDEDF